MLEQENNTGGAVAQNKPGLALVGVVAFRGFSLLCAWVLF